MCRPEGTYRSINTFFFHRSHHAPDIIGFLRIRIIDVLVAGKHRSMIPDHVYPHFGQEFGIDLKLGIREIGVMTFDQGTSIR